MKLLPHIFERILGTGGVLAAASDVDGYRGDLAVPSGGDIVCVVRPRWVQQLAEIVTVCRREGIAIVPRGGGTGLCGGATAVPSRRSVVVSFERMAAIRGIDRGAGTMVAEAGCTLHQLRAAVAEVDSLFAIDHGGLSSQLGGNLSTNAGGNNVLRYGMAREQVLGLEVVLASGEILSELQPLPKNNSGYDLKQIFIGAEGTLGLITAAALKLYPQPVAQVCACVGLPSLNAVLDFFVQARAALGQAVSAFEVMSREALDLWFAHAGREDQPFATLTPWVVLLEADTTSRRFDLAGALEDLLAAASERGTVIDGTIAMTEAQRSRLWALREGVPVAMIETKGSLKGDTAVPLSRIPKFVERASTAVSAIVPGCIAVPFGHVGDGNIHFNVLPPPAMSAEAFSSRHGELARAIESVALSLGGTVSAEHGIGLLKRQALARMKSPAALDAMRALKQAFDPGNILNPGKVLPD
ncbi:MAG: FAD-binding oxidoreductase [Xanthobacteraceae bacterium]